MHAPIPAPAPDIGDDLEDYCHDCETAAALAMEPWCDDPRCLERGPLWRKRETEGGASRPRERGESMRAVVNLKHEPRLREKFERTHIAGNTVLIDRRTKWGNPFRLGVDGDREQVIALYRADLWRRIRAGEIALEELAALDSCWLACWCEPLPCHGDVLARAAEWAARVLDDRDGA